MAIRAFSRSRAAPRAVELQTHTVYENAAPVVIDRYRAFVFPNRIREQRRRYGFPKLMALSERLRDIPYIRLSKIERGEVIARASELRWIAHALDVEPTDLLTDVTRSDFDIATWAQPFKDRREAPAEEEVFAVQLAAALRTLRTDNAALTIANLEKQHGLPPVILSRLENAYKTFDRWNPETIASVCALFEVADEAALRARVDEQYRRGDLNAYVGRVADPAIRMERTRSAIAALAAELSSPPERAPAEAGRSLRPALPKADAVVAAPALPVFSTAKAAGQKTDSVQNLAVYGTPLSDGLIARARTQSVVPAPYGAGPQTFALNVCRATLGPGLPANAVVVVDPGRMPSVGGLAVLRSAEGYRLVTVTFDRAGVRKGYSVMPDLEFDIDDLDPADVHAVIAAIYP
jgi:transcriptional regulator with XRE-family HTH domain